MKAWSRTSAILLAMAIVGLTACSRERSDDVRDGDPGMDGEIVTG